MSPKAASPILLSGQSANGGSSKLLTNLRFDSCFVITILVFWLPPVAIVIPKSPMLSDIIFWNYYNPDISGHDYKKKLVRMHDRFEGEIAPPDHPLWKETGCDPAKHQVLKIIRGSQGDTPSGCEAWWHNPSLKEPDWNNTIRIDLPGGGVEIREKVGSLVFSPEDIAREEAEMAKRLEAVVREMGGRTIKPSGRTNDEINEDIYGRKQFRRMKRRRSFQPENQIPGRVYAKGSSRLLPIPTKEFYSPEEKKRQQEIIDNLVEEPSPLTDEEKARGVTIPYEEFYSNSGK